MRTRVWLIIIFVVFIGYAPQVSQSIYRWGYRSESVHALPEMRKFETPCDARKDDSKCGKSYSIPMSLLRANAKGLTDPTVSFGLLLRAVGFRCDNSNSYFRTFDNIKTPGMDRAESNRTKTMGLDSIPCSTKLIIETWSSPREGRVGWVGGDLVVGESQDIFKIRRINDFWLNDFRIVLALLLQSAWFLVYLTRKNLISNYALSPLERALPWLACSNLLNSGLITSIVPITENPETLNSVSLLFSTLAFKEIALEGLGERAEKFIYSALLIFFLFPVNSFFKLHLCSAFIGITLIRGIRDRSITHSLFALFGILATLKIMNFPWAPHSHVHAVFAFVTLALGLRRRLVQIFSAVSSQIYSKKNFSSEDLELTIRAFIKTFPEVTLKLYALNPGNRAQVTIASSDLFRKATIDVLPPVVSNVISTGVSTGIRNRTDEELVLLAKGNGELANWSYIAPVRLSNKLLGVLEISFDEIGGWDRHMEIDTIQISIDLLIISLAEFLTRQHSYEKGEALSKISDAIRVLEKISPSSMSHASYFAESGKLLSDALNCSTLIMELDSSTREMKVIEFCGYTPEAQEHILNSKFYALENNRHGPAALAMNENRIIIVEDLAWLKQGVKDKTQNLFSKNGSRSGMALPVNFDSSSENHKYVIWLESRSLQAFKFEFADNYQALVDYLLGKVSERLAKSRALNLEEKLSDFIPSKAREKISLGLDPTEVDFGYLMMFDLKGSTRLSLKLGLEKYTQLVMDLKNHCVACFRNFEFDLHEYRWDSFYLTRTTSAGTSLSSEDLVHLSIEMESSFKKWLEKFDELRNSDYLGFRLCIVEGDISRGLSVGKTSSWTIIGTAMARVSKLEASVKNLNGITFSLHAERFVHSDFWFETELKVQGLESEKVAILKLPTAKSIAA